MGIVPIIPEHKVILDKIRELWIESGGRPISSPEVWGLNNTDKSDKGIEILFDYGCPHFMYTPDGFYTIIGGGFIANTDKFWELFTKEFKIEAVTPARDENKISVDEYVNNFSGPVVRIL